MALHARELIRRATAAFTRQLQVCVWPGQGSASTPGLSGMCLRGFYTSSYSNSLRPGPPSTGKMGGQAMNRGAVERIRIKMTSTSDAPKRIKTVAKNSPRGDKKSPNKSVKAATESGAGNFSASSKRNPPTKTATQGRVSTAEGQGHTRSNRKQAPATANQSSAVKLHDKLNQDPTAGKVSLTEPMSKLSRDINQWFNDVMEHLANAESASSATAAEKMSTSSRKQQRLIKSTSSSTSEPRKLAKSDADKPALQNGTFGSDRSNMLEIKPSLVETSGTVDTSLASTAAWVPYGSLHDTLQEASTQQKGNTTGRWSTPGTPVLKPPGSASSVYEVLPGRRKPASNAVCPGGPESTGAKLSKQNSWETGKGFILLNNKDKAKEALERLEWLKKNQETKTKTLSDVKNTGFILVDSDRLAGLSSADSADKRNILLSDNPHKAAAERARVRRGNTKQPGMQAKKTSGTSNTGSDTTAAGSFIQNTTSKVGRHGNTNEASTAKEAEVKRWVDLVQRKLFEIQKAKQAAKKPTQTSASQFKEQIATDQKNSKKERVGAKQGRVQNANTDKLATRPHLPNKPDGVPETRKPITPTGTKNPDLDKDKNPMSDPKPVENPDAEYERRIGQFINSSMGYEDSADSSKITKFFGPLTREQQNLLEKARKMYNQGHPNPNLNEVYIQTKTHSKPVPVSELKPEVKSRPKLDKAERVLGNKNEPTLCVKPEEIAPLKKVTQTTLNEAPRLSSTKGQSDEHSYLRSINSAVNGKEDTPIIKSCHTVKSERVGTNNRSKSENTATKKTSYLSSSAESKNNLAPIFLQHEFLKLQQEKLAKSRTAKQRPETTSQSSGDQVGKSGVKLTSPCPESFIDCNEESHAEREAPLEPKTSFVVTESPQKQNIKELGSTKRVLSDNATSKDLDPFQAWIQSMEDRKPEVSDKTYRPLQAVIKRTKANSDKHGHRNSSNARKSVSGEDTSTEKTSEPKPPRENKYPRFDDKGRQDMALKMSRDMRATYTSPHPSSIGRACSDPESKPDRVLTELSQSDLIYSWIRPEGVRPCSGIPLAGSTSPPPTRRSKVLTQAGLGTAISNTTGLVDPTKLPKLGNLFSSFDGFITMDATPVLDATKSSNSSNSATARGKDDSLSASLAGGDRLAESVDLRASLAKEREAASLAARKKLIEEYEKHIQNYERGLDLYRSRLRRVRQTMIAEHKPPQPPPETRESDNPRRHSD
ncbi:hypothetical protein ElyMa_002287200 [Elysia marginata]|uniref:SoHo domain-containing protein n=1 Tax=Elysia marginata TaxID=1093978 RepID=A0AAV4G293_9GAST|nr:hypothetical protein ElyMa_002287200 [Elysia marginata]